MIIKVTGLEVACNSTPSSFGGMRLVRIANLHESHDALITQTNESNSTIGTFTLLSSSEVLVEKNATDKFSSNNDTYIVAVPVAFTN